MTPFVPRLAAPVLLLVALFGLCGCSSDRAAGTSSSQPVARAEIRAVLSSSTGACSGDGVATVGDAARCVVLGPVVPVADRLTDAWAELRGDLGWVVRVRVAEDDFASVRDALAAAGADRYALVADGAVVLEFGYTALAQDGSIGPLLSEAEARRAAAALTGGVADETDPEGPRVDADFWLSALGVRVCGTWLANAPIAAPEAGVHSHGDGLVYVHPTTAAEAGAAATLGLFLANGGWAATADSLRVWDGVAHRDGDRCPDGRAARLRWWVDGAEQTGDPSTYRLRHRQVIVLSFDTDDVSPGDPPQADALPVPMLGPSFAG